MCAAVFFSVSPPPQSRSQHTYHDSRYSQWEYSYACSRVRFNDKRTQQVRILLGLLECNSSGVSTSRQRAADALRHSLRSTQSCNQLNFQILQISLSLQFVAQMSPFVSVRRLFVDLRKMLQSESLLAQIGFDTAENEPSKFLKRIV